MTAIQDKQFQELSMYLLPARMQWYCEQFVGAPYLIAPCGEGESGYVSQAPVYRWDGFDCVTFVNTMLACVLSESLVSFEHWIHVLSYMDDRVAYLLRRHFVSADWNPVLESMEVLVNTTDQVCIDDQLIAMQSQATIDRSAWYAHHTPAQQGAIEQEILSLALNNQLNTEHVQMQYLPMVALLEHTQAIVSQLPAVGVIEVVRESAFFTSKVGTEMHVSHIGIVVESMFYHASTESREVVKLPLADYIQKMQACQQVLGLHVHSLSSADRLLTSCAW